MSSFWHAHNHSHYSVLDGMSPVKRLVQRAHKLNQPAMGLTDHGVMSGVFQLYSECRKLDMIPFPGIELYVVDDVSDKGGDRFHLTLNAFTTAGYKFLVKLSSLSHDRSRYHFKPRVDWDDLSDLASYDPVGASGVAAYSGCYFGVLIRHYGDDEEAQIVLRKLCSIFPNTYVELQQHNTNHDNGVTDNDIVEWCIDQAESASLPLIATNDCHYCVQKEVGLHTRMKMLAYGGADPGDVGFPGDSYHLSSELWMSNHFSDHQNAFNDALDSLNNLCEKNKLSIPTLDKYKYYVPGGFADAMDVLRTRCGDVINSDTFWGGRRSRSKYIERLTYELSVVESLGFADYFLLVQDYTDYCRDNGIAFNARGSANGSLICYLLGITSIDPIRWKLSFDRFLTVDRERPPDIDLDVEDHRRSEVIDYLSTKYDLAQIGTYNRLGVDAETGRGSMFVSWIASRKRAVDPKRFAATYAKAGSMDDLSIIDGQHVVDELHELGKMSLLKSPGAHAAGFVLSAPGHNISDWMPLMLIPSSGSVVTQMTMEDVEDAGYVKIDLLGLRSLTTLRRIKELCNLPLGFEPALDDKAVYSMLRKGVEGTGIFQFEGYTAAKGCKQLRVKSIHDLILVNALYRPAARESGYTEMYIRRRRKLEPVTYPHQIFEGALKDTLGVPTFQEQVLEVLRELGFDPSGINQILKAIKRSGVGSLERNDATFADNYQQFCDLATDVGMTDQQVDESWAMVEGFARYGFNRAHSTAYSLLGYQLAWFKVNYSLEFHSALLETTAGTPKERQYVQEARRCGARILPPDVNISGHSWTIDSKRQAIRRGIVSIDGVGEVAALEIWGCQPFSSVEDMIERCNARAVTGGKNWSKDGTLSGTMLKLKQAGALSSLGINKED